MEYDERAIDEATLALMYLGRIPERQFTKTWKSFDWDVLERLHEAGLILDPKSKARSVLMTEEGVAKSKALFEKLFSIK